MHWHLLVLQLLLVLAGSFWNLHEVPGLGVVEADGVPCVDPRGLRFGCGFWLLFLQGRVGEDRGRGMLF